MLDMDLARELKVAQLPWQPRRGDLAMDRLNVPLLVLSDGTDDAGAVEVDTGQAVERRHFMGLTWLPHLDQLLAILARHGPFDLSARPAGGARRDVVWEVSLRPVDGAAPRRFRATDACDAAGRALHYVLAETGWRPSSRPRRGPA
jgi:hypothetical protein